VGETKREGQPFSAWEGEQPGKGKRHCRARRGADGSAEGQGGGAGRARAWCEGDEGAEWAPRGNERGEGTGGGRLGCPNGPIGRRLGFGFSLFYIQ
jgi:hypothetical protein